MTGYRPRALSARHRVALILAVLYDAEFPLTTKEVAAKLGQSYASTYNTLRALCGSNSSGRSYADNTGSVTVPGYPVIWHSWDATTDDTPRVRFGVVTWELTPAERDARTHEIARLEASFQVPS